MSSLLIIFISLLLSAFFSGMEIAFVSSNKLMIELNRKQGQFPSGIIAIFTKNPGQYLSTMLVGNNIALVVYGIIMAALLNPVIARFTSSSVVILVSQTILSTLLILFTAEFLPKVLFRINPNIVLNVFAVPVLFFYVLLYPVARFITAIANFILRIFTKVDPKKTNQEAIFGKVDLDHLVSYVQPDSKDEEDAEHEIKIFQNALDFSSIKIRDCMIPRIDIVAIEEHAPISELKQKFIATGLSKIIVYSDDIDNIVGYVHSKELFRNPESIQSKVNTLTFVPETMSANKLMQLFMQEHKSIAIVVDEYGGTSGLLTLEDLIEEIFGEIEDEHDKDNLVEKKIGENEYLFSGRIEIEHLNEAYHLDIPEKNDYDTLAGFILYHHLNFPKAGEIIHVDSYTFIIRKTSNTRIDLIQMGIHKK